MTEPLINVNDLSDAYWSGKSVADAEARAMAYLRSVLTPEALEPAEVFVDYDGCNSIRILKGSDLHRRIFGEDTSGN